MNRPSIFLDIKSILANEIVFKSRYVPSIYGFIQQGEEFIETEYVLERMDLVRLLNQNGNVGSEIQRLVDNIFLQANSPQPTINLVERFGMTQELKAINIKVEKDFQAGKDWTLIKLFVHKVSILETFTVGV
jgi:hypothetical protein